MENTFSPLYTNQIFPEEKITGYKNLKILISLTPKLLFPHIKIVYDSVASLRDDIEDLLKIHYGHVYNTDESTFIQKLDEDLVSFKPPIGQVIKTEGNLEVKNYIIFR
jgi:hypothetical protein